MKSFRLSALFYNIVVALFLVAAILPFAGEGIALIFAAVWVATGFLPASLWPNYSLRALPGQVWATDIANNIYPDNAFYQKSKDDSSFLKGNKVNLPQSGTAPGIIVNPSSYPLTATPRTDTDQGYNINTYAIQPVQLTLTEEEQNVYDKRESILFDIINQMKTAVADTMAIAWAPSLASKILRTSGSSRNPYGASQTGTRLAVAKNDILGLQRLMNADDVPLEDRYLLIDANLYMDILNTPEFVNMYIIGSPNLVKGAIMELLGFQVFVRSRALVYDNTGTPIIKAYGSAAAGTDNLGIMAWHKDYVRMALGNATNGGIEVMVQEKNPQYLGDLLGGFVNSGGMQARSDAKGIYSLIETKNS